MNSNFYICGTNGRTYDFDLSVSGNICRLTVKNIEADEREISVKSDIFNHSQSEKGYYLLPDTPMKGGCTVNFRKKRDCGYAIENIQMPAFGICAEKSYLIISAKMPGAMKIMTCVKNGEFYIYPVFTADGFGFYENVTLDIIELGAYCSVSDMAEAYRNYQLTCGGCVALAEREKDNDILGYLADSIEIRIRMGWKPVPSPVEEQTEENEPEMFVACTFERVAEFMAEMKRSGIEKAHITLVGWNKSGHDGRWPQIFPVDERLGGIEGLKKLIAYADEIGYKIACHTNSTDAYTIADNLSDTDLLIGENGEREKGYVWGGGRAYMLCPEKALKIAEAELPKVKDAGFTGALYIDVLSAIEPKVCFDKTHMQTKADCIESWKDILSLSKKLFGAVGSEGGYTYLADSLDYVYYSYGRNDLFTENDEFFDTEIPFWQMVYNGIILSNAYTETTNFTIKNKKTMLKAVETNSRPTFYLFSKFMKGSDQDNWLGVEDLVTVTDEDLKTAVAKIKEGYDLYRKTSKLSRCFITGYEVLENGVRRVTYSDGSVVSVDYENEEYMLDIK